MTEEEYFRKHYPDFCYGDRLLSPYWDLFQYGVEFGERQSEKKIEELEKKLEQTEKDLADYQFNYPKIKELEKENAELNNFIMQSKKDGISPINALIIKNLGNQLTKAKDHIKTLLDCLKQDTNDPQTNYYVCQYMDKAEQFLKEIEK